MEYTLAFVDWLGTEKGQEVLLDSVGRGKALTPFSSLTTFDEVLIRVRGGVDYIVAIYDEESKEFSLFDTLYLGLSDSDGEGEWVPTDKGWDYEYFKHREHESAKKRKDISALVELAGSFITSDAKTLFRKAVSENKVYTVHSNDTILSKKIEDGVFAIYDGNRYFYFKVEKIGQGENG